MQALIAGTARRRQLRCREAGWGGSRSPSTGLDVQKPDIRPGPSGKRAMDRDAQLLFGDGRGKSGEDRWKELCFTLGDLRVCSEEPN